MILIFSPQEWSHQFVSKHHYAIEFSRLDTVYFFEPVQCGLGRLSINLYNPYLNNKNLNVLRLWLPLPYFLQFKAKSLFNIICKYFINYVIRKYNIRAKILIDFGYHDIIKTWTFINCKTKIYFPVDDFHNLPISLRGCNYFWSVSKNVCDKFNTRKIDMNFINHGLNRQFAELARERLKLINNNAWNRAGSKIQVGYSGNLAISFLDRELILFLIENFPDCDFNFYGQYKYNGNAEFLNWIDKLKDFKNVHLFGQLAVEDLSRSLFSMDILLICYKPDFKNYHLENTHKLNEYLSTGLPLLSSRVSVLNNDNFYYQIHSSDLQNTKKMFEMAISEVNMPNTTLMAMRINYALRFTYEENIAFIFKDTFVTF